ncbi:hypothetical protein OHB54_04315 [Streptomyces sp. NBC_01007]|nr:hypothetical protein [Streptomyces rhizosphaerihabitans]MCT9007379.1 hypothetical protein [Streptomyces rhizosphaerihabitans]WRZ88341.1 hypothetical protein OHB54_04315 [Streptomyces sp. NBC_01007]
MTDEKYLAPVLSYRDRIKAVLVGALPWDGVEAVLVRLDGHVCWTAPSQDLDEPLRTWFGAAG